MTHPPGDTEQRATWLSRELIESGSELSGAMAGAAIGLIGGPPGALAGAAAGVALTHTFRWVGSELRQRVLGPREEVRVGGAYAIALARIDERIHEGEPLRPGFAEEQSKRRSVAEELLEGTLLMAARSYEERKIPLLGRMYASLAMTWDITTGYAHFLLRLADRLTYRQLVMLAIVGSEARERLALLDKLVEGRISGSVFGVTQELDELDAVGCLGVEGGKVGVGSLAEMTEFGTFSGVPLSDLALRPNGHMLFKLMELQHVPDSDRDEVLAEWVPPDGP